MSPALVASGFRIADWEAAAVDSIGEASTLVAVRVAEFTVDEREPAGGYIDLAGLDEDTSRQRLLAALRSGRTSGDGPGRVPAGHAAMAAPRFPGAMPPVWNVYASLSTTPETADEDGTGSRR